MKKNTFSLVVTLAVLLASTHLATAKDQEAIEFEAKLHMMDCSITFLHKIYEMGAFDILNGVNRDEFVTKYADITYDKCRVLILKKYGERVIPYLDSQVKPEVKDIVDIRIYNALSFQSAPKETAEQYKVFKRYCLDQVENAFATFEQMIAKDNYAPIPKTNRASIRRSWAIPNINSELFLEEGDRCGLLSQDSHATHFINEFYKQNFTVPVLFENDGSFSEELYLSRPNSTDNSNVTKAFVTFQYDDLSLQAIVAPRAK